MASADEADGFDDLVGHRLHLRLEADDFVKLDGRCGRLHLVDGVIHRADQRSDGPAIKRREEGAAHGEQHFADHVIGGMLAVADLADPLRGIALGARQPGKGISRVDAGCRMAFEHAEEIARLGQETLEPAEHR